ncbi:MAG: cell division ATPase MinD [Candidatus Aenigmatarchaeota archaeon]
MARIIGIVSGKGGVGKTTLTANLAIAISKLGKSVTVVDCNLTTSHLGFLFDFHFYPRSLNDVLAGKSSLEEAIFFKEGIGILPASLKVEDLVDVNPERLKEIVERIQADFVLLDSAPGLGREALSVLKSAQEIIFVATPHLNSIVDVMKCEKIVKSLQLSSLGIVLNMVKGYSHELSKRDVERITNLPVIAEIPYDEEVSFALSLGKPVVLFNPYTPSSVAFKKLAEELTGESLREKKPTFFSKFFINLKKKFFFKPKLKAELIEKI